MKKLILLAVIIVSAVSARASFLYWQLDNADVADDIKALDYGYARIVATSNTQTPSQVTQMAELNNKQMEAWQTFDLSQLGGDGSSYSYYIELGTYSGSTFSAVAQSETQTYSQIATTAIQPTATLSASAPVNFSTWHAGNFRAVPEPTSAILMLFGAAMLGLKRKNRSLN